MREYTIILEPDAEGGPFVVYVPALQGCVTQGHDEANAVAMAKDVIVAYCNSCKDHGESVPDDVELVDMSAYGDKSFIRKVRVDV